jgi:6-pyruvoyltetrahydropterin/6-carboxytetrahydropterin synthase
MHVCVRDGFPAAHRIRIASRGEREPVHVHHWRVELCFRAEEGDAPLAHAALRALQAWTQRHRGRSLNDVPPYDTVNPTAEEVARAVAEEIGPQLGLDVVRVTVGEAAGFSATYWPPTAVAARDQRR